MNDVILEMVIYKELFLGVLFFILSVYEYYLKILGVFFEGDLIKEKDFYY